MSAVTELRQLFDLVMEARRPLECRVRELEEALRDMLTVETSDPGHVHTLGAIRRARAALGEKP
jgi:hypothetical protein